MTQAQIRMIVHKMTIPFHPDVHLGSEFEINGQKMEVFGISFTPSIDHGIDMECQLSPINREQSVNFQIESAYLDWEDVIAPEFFEQLINRTVGNRFTVGEPTVVSDRFYNHSSDLDERRGFVFWANSWTHARELFSTGSIPIEAGSIRSFSLP